MTHLWVRAEQRPNERRVGLTADGARRLLERGLRVTVEDSADRCIPTEAYRAAGCEIVAPHSWPDAPPEAVVFGLKELPQDDRPLSHRHVMFGHAFKGQPGAEDLLRRFARGGGTLYDLEYLVDEDGRRVAAFGYWAGYAGAAVAAVCWAAQRRNAEIPSLQTFGSDAALRAFAADALQAAGPDRPGVIVIGALGRVGRGAATLCGDLGLAVTRWDMAETAFGGPFPEILAHDIFLNCILAQPGTPVFVPETALTAPRTLRVIGDIACDPGAAYSPVPLYDRTTDWRQPALRVHDDPPLDIVAIDNLPSLLPAESSADFADQLLPHLHTLDRIDTGVWGRARDVFDDRMARLAEG